MKGLVGATALISGAQHACALRGGQVLCWGENTEGRFGSGFPKTVSVPTPIPGITDAVELKALDEALWIRRQSGEIRGLGSLPESGLVIQADTAPRDTVELVGGSGFLCFRREGGSIVCHLQTVGEREPREITLAGGPYTALAATASEVCSIHQDGHVGCWQPAEAAAQARSARIDALRDCAIKRELAAALAAARRSAGRRPSPPAPVICDAADKLDPPLPEYAVPDLADARSLAGSLDRLCAVSRDGVVRCWGRGRDGQLADGRVQDSQAAVVVSLPGPAARVFAAKGLSCAGLQDSRFFCWGRSPLGIESKAFVVCNDTWLARLWCAATPGAVTVLPASR